MSALPGWMTDWSFWLIAARDAERTLICPPEREVQIKQLIRERGMDHVFKVESSAACPPDQLLIIDHHAVEASSAEALQRDRRAGYFRFY